MQPLLFWLFQNTLLFFATFYTHSISHIPHNMIVISWLNFFFPICSYHPSLLCTSFFFSNHIFLLSFYTYCLVSYYAYYNLHTVLPYYFLIFPILFIIYTQGLSLLSCYSLTGHSSFTS